MLMNKPEKKIKNDLDKKKTLQKMGRYAGLTALGTFMLLNPKKAQANSPTPPGDGWE